MRPLEEIASPLHALVDGVKIAADVAVVSKLRGRLRAGVVARESLRDQFVDARLVVKSDLGVDVAVYATTPKGQVAAPGRSARRITHVAGAGALSTRPTAAAYSFQLVVSA